LNKTLVPVNHVEVHLYAAYLADPGLKPPLVALAVSGGHTSLFYIDADGEMLLMGRTLDDAAGEAFDKVAKMMGLGYPGGPAIERRAARARGKPPRFPQALLGDDSLDFSFSGLKTAVLNHLLARGDDYLPTFGETELDLICAGFQNAVAGVLAEKTRRALEAADCRTLAVVGGVAANGYIRKKMTELSPGARLKVVVPDPALCTDNAAMVACCGLHHLRKGTVTHLPASVSSRTQWKKFSAA
jgi:N6-L-threonylcarbamoyladenine synthase